MTEQEAKHTACCGLIGGIDALLLAGGRDDHTEDGTASPRLCIGRHCMGWRWNHYTPQGEPVIGHGYCGLAGRPE